MAYCACGKRIPGVSVYTPVPDDRYEIKESDPLVAQVNERMSASHKAFCERVDSTAKSAEFNTTVALTLGAMLLEPASSELARTLVPAAKEIGADIGTSAAENYIHQVAEGTVTQENRARGFTVLQQVSDTTIRRTWRTSLLSVAFNVVRRAQRVMFEDQEE